MLPKDLEREERIFEEIIVDAHDEDEQRMGWYYYMDEKVRFPFKAEVVLEKRSGEKIVQKVDVLKLTCEVDFGSDLTLSYANSVPASFFMAISAFSNVEVSWELT